MFIFGLILLPAEAVELYWYKWFDMRAYCLDIVVAQKCFGETVKSMTKRRGAIFGVNGGYFDPRKSSKVPLGQIWCNNQDFTQYTLAERRGCFWQDDVVEIDWRAPDGVYCSMEGGPNLVHDGRIVRSYQGFSKAHWNRDVIRNVMATKGNRVYFFRLKGSLWSVAKFLKKWGMEDAINFDGGSSCAKGARVSNAIVVLPKGDKAFQNYQKAKHFLEELPQQRSAWDGPGVNPNLKVQTSKLRSVSRQSIWK